MGLKFVMLRFNYLKKRRPGRQRKLVDLSTCVTDKFVQENFDIPNDISDVFVIESEVLIKMRNGIRFDPPLKQKRVEVYY